MTGHRYPGHNRDLPSWGFRNAHGTTIILTHAFPSASVSSTLQRCDFTLNSATILACLSKLTVEHVRTTLRTAGLSVAAQTRSPQQQLPLVAPRFWHSPPPDSHVFKFRLHHYLGINTERRLAWMLKTCLLYAPFASHYSQELDRFYTPVSVL